MKNILLSLSLALGSLISFGQTIDTANIPVWIDMMQDPSANFYDIQNAFEQYWEGRERSRGDGWKVFKRWEWYWQERINPDGTFPPVDQTINNYTSWRIAYNQSLSGTESINGDWSEVGPRMKPVNGTGQPNGNGRLNSIAFHPTNPSIMWVGSASGGLWKTSNGGQSWDSNTDDLPSLGVSSILVDPTNTNIMYIGTGDRDAGDAPGLGVYKSVDGGASWFASNTGMGNQVVGQMLMHPNNPSYILAATSGGVYRSLNGGSSWSLESPSNNYKDMKFQPGNPNIVYATETSGGANFWRSTDAGDSWTQIASGLNSSQRLSIAVTPADSTVVYLVSSVSSAFGGLFKSTDAGLNFTTQSTTPNILQWSENPAATGGGGQGWYDLAIVADPTNANIVYVGGVNIFKSLDSGVTWDCAAHWVGSPTAASVHADHHWLEYSPVDGRLYNCNDGGLYYTSDGGATWPEISDSLGVAQIYKIGVSQNTNPLVINGYQDNGTAVWDNTIFRTERGGDGMECIIDPNNDNVMYASVYYGNIARSMNNGVSFGGFAANNVNGITEEGAWVTPYILDQHNSDIMFIGYKNVWRTMNALASPPTFIPISASLAGSNSSNMRQLRQGKIDGNRLFAIRSDNKFFRSDNALGATPTWVDLTSNLPGSGTLRDVETSAFDNDEVWIIRNNIVYRSTNGGSTWTNINSNLPAINKNCLVADPLSNEGIYIGTDAGVYYTDNTLPNWIPFDNGLPASVEITELEIYHPAGDWTSSRLRAGTYGRGLWESDLYYPLNIAPTAFFDVSIEQTSVCDPDTIELINNSAYGATSTTWTITPNAAVTFVNGTSSTSFNASIVVDEIGLYDVQLIVSNANGTDSTEVIGAIEVQAGLSLPLYEDFEDNSPCATGGCNTNCTSLDWTNVENGNGDDDDWRTDFGGTPSAGTGPNVDYAPGNGSGNYMYLESSWCLNQVAHLESPCISLDNLTAPEIKFAYHRNGNPSLMNPLNVDILSSGTWQNLWTITGVQGDVWQLDSIDLSAYGGQNVKLRFNGTSGSEWQADMAIDGIELTAAPEAQFVANDTSICLNTGVTFTDLSSQNPTAWLWTITPATYQFTGGTSQSSQNPSIIFLDTVQYTISLQASNAFGSSTFTNTNYIDVVAPYIGLLSDDPNNIFCEGDTVHLTTIPGYSLYKFYKNNSLIQLGANEDAVVLDPQNNDSIHVNVTDSNGCTSEEGLSLSILENPISVLSSDAENNTICNGDSVQFINTGDSSIIQHAFILQGFVEQQDSINSWSTSFLADQDSVKVRITDINDCKGWSNAVYMIVLPLPATPTIVLGDSLSTVSLAESYHWMFDESSAFTLANTFPKMGDGTYFLRVFEGGCWSLWSDPLIITGIEELGGLSLKLYPSPAKETINLKFENIGSTNQGDIYIFDMTGRQVKMLMNANFSEGQELQINIGELSTGMYNIMIQSGEKQVTLPFIKEKQ